MHVRRSLQIRRSTCSDRDDDHKLLEPDEVVRVARNQRHTFRHRDGRDQQVREPPARLAPRGDHCRVSPPVRTCSLTAERDRLECRLGTL